MKRLIIALVGLLTLSWGSPAFAWGNSGHRTVCEIAFRNLTPIAKAEVLRLLAAHPVIPLVAPRNKEFGWACTYPDNPVPGGPGRRSPEHFVNYDRTTMVVTQQMGCGSAALCILKAIEADWNMLRTPSMSDKDRAEALMYLGHWFGDIHQPLHVSYADDLGGNEVNVHGLCTGKLHSAWDTCILRQRAYADDGEPSIADTVALAATWSEQVTDLERAEWLSSQPWQWAAESYAITIKPAVGYCVMTGGVCRYSASQTTFPGSGTRTTVLVDAAYMNGAMPIIQRRITQAGIRLAHRLNLALDPMYRGATP